MALGGWGVKCEERGDVNGRFLDIKCILFIRGYLPKLCPSYSTTVHHEMPIFGACSLPETRSARWDFDTYCT